MLEISTLQMKYALEVYKAGSISQAAKNLYMNQPNLSKAIKELEQTLGIVIFVRTPKGVILSKEGSLFLQYAENILKKINELENRLKDQKKNNVSFNISIPRATYITYAFTEFVKEIQGSTEIKINYSETNNAEAVDNLLYHGFDMGIIRHTQPYEAEFLQTLGRNNLTSKKIWESEYWLLMSKEHPLANAPEVKLEDLKEYTELVHGDENSSKINPGSDRSKQISLYERGSQFDLLRNVPTTYMWVSPLPDPILEKNQLIQKRCADNHILFCDTLITRGDYEFSQFASHFITTLQRIRDEIIQHFNIQ